MAVLGRQLTISRERPEMPLAQLQGAGEGGVGQQGAAGEINLNNILALIPADIVSIYIAGKGISSVMAHGETPTFFQAHWSLICFAACFVACAVFRMIASTPPGQAKLFANVNWSLVIVTLIAFFLWAHAVSETGPVWDSFASAYAGFFAMIFGVIAPKLVRAT